MNLFSTGFGFGLTWFWVLGFGFLCMNRNSSYVKIEFWKSWL